MKPLSRLASWPRIALLALAAVALIAPRLWQPEANPAERHAVECPSVGVQPESMPELSAIQAEAPRPTEVRPVVFEPPVAERNEKSPQTTAPAPAAEVATRPPRADGRPVWDRTRAVQLTGPAGAPQPADAEETPSGSADAPAKELEEPRQLAERPPVEMVTPDPVLQGLPAALLDELEYFAGTADGRDWARAAGQRVHILMRLPIGSPDALKMLADLRKLANDAPQWATECKTDAGAITFLRLGYALTRRLDIWDRLYKGDLLNTPAVAQSNTNIVIASLAQLETAPRTADGHALREWLLFEVLRREVRRTEVDPTDRAAIAHTVLQRIRQTKFAAGPRPPAIDQALAALESELRRWITQPITGEQLLRQIELFERGRSAAEAKDLAVLTQRLRDSDQPAQRDLAQVVDLHYRNANIRLAINDRIMNRLIPSPPPISGPVKDVIGGVPVEGVSTTTTNLKIKLIPDAKTLKLNLEATGTIASQTTSNAGPATFQNHGNATYVATKLVTIQPEGVLVRHAQADANSDSQLQGLRTTYENVPLFGRMASNMAKTQYGQRQGETKVEVEGKITAQVKERLDQEVDRRLASVEELVKSRVLKPLSNLDLTPSVSTLTTTDQRIILRLRMAADDQLGAYTPRPQAPAESWASLQIHQSAINNALAQLKLGGRPFTPAELQKYLSERLDAPNILAAKKDPVDDVRLTFAEQEPIKVECNNGRLTISVSFAELETDKGRFTNFTGRVHYIPAPEGQRALLVRDGTLELIGEKLNTRSQITLRGVISKMFPRDKKIQLLPEKWLDDPRLKDLLISQCALEDGWIGLAVAPARTAQRLPPAGKKDPRG